jgi:pilus assembly protein CpaB
MKSKAPLFVLIGAIFFGLLAAVSVSSYLSSTRANNKLNTIVVARLEIPLGAKIVADQLTTVQMPIGATPEGSFADTTQVVGRVAATRLLARETITAARLAPLGSIAGLSAVIPEGMRAMTVKVEDDSGMSGFVLPGTIVDVAAVIKVKAVHRVLGQAIDDTVSKIVLQNIKVLANGDNLDEPEDKRDAQKARTVTLLVAPDQAERLLLASADGKLRLVMRNGADQSNQPTRGADVNTLLTEDGDLSALNFARGEATPAPKATFAPVRRALSKLRPTAAVAAEVPLQAVPPPRNQVEVIEGMKKRTVEFP